MKSHLMAFSVVLLLLLGAMPLMQGSVMKESCLTTSHTKVSHNFLRSYSIQHKPLFPVDAVRFLTIKGITICSSPSSPWAIKAMKYLDAKKKSQSISHRSAH